MAGLLEEEVGYKRRRRATRKGGSEKLREKVRRVFISICPSKSLY